MTSKTQHHHHDSLEEKAIECINLSTVNETNNILEVRHETVNNGGLVLVNGELIHYFNQHSTFLHKLFRDEFATKLIDSLYSKRLIGMAVFGCAIYGILWTIQVSQAFYFHIFEPAYFIYSICYCLWVDMFFITAILGVNTRAFHLIKKSFDFWIKIFYAIQLFMAFVAYYLYFSGNSNILLTLHVIGTGMIILLATITFSFLDGHSVSSRLKCSIGIAVAVLFSIVAYYYSFMVLDRAIIYSSKMMTISLVDMISSDLQILAIFFAKQGLSSLFRPTKCLSIRHTPYFVWTSTKTDNIHKSTCDKDDGSEQKTEMAIDIGPTDLTQAQTSKSIYSIGSVMVNKTLSVVDDAE
eukprot:123734_1